MNYQARCALSALFVAASVSFAGPASADVTISSWGYVSPQNPTDPWDLGLTPLVVRGGTVDVTYGGTLISPGASVAGGLDWVGAVRVDGYGSTWINNGSINIGGDMEGQVVIRNGAAAITDDLVVGTRYSLHEGRLIVEGYDATMTSTANTYIGHTGQGHVELKQGASLFSHNVYIGGSGGCMSCGGDVAITGSGTQWVSTGEFVLGVRSHSSLDIYRGQLFTVNARILGDDIGYMTSHASVSGWGGTWTNQGLLRVGSNYGYGTLTVGAYGTLVTEDTEIRSQLGGGFVKVNDVYASWLNSGDVTVLAIGNQSPSLLVDKGALVSIGGLLRTAPWASGDPYPYLGPSVRLADGDLIAGAMEVAEGDFEFAGGRLQTGSFVGDLANTQAGELSVGEAHPSTIIAGSYSQGPGATLSITVAGPSSVPLLQVDGDLHLGGALRLLPADGPVSFQAGDAIAVFGWSGGLTGTLTAVDIDVPLAPGLAWDTSALQTTGEIIVVPAP
ncbi:hypothetical protein BE18_50755 [Sorangium cellulosum]|uniref:Secreted protein n=1 Tax=Sorangium cellulosum TaxID=56 RepID=A0A150RK35_SORCE|nr:hypothetical protein BE18_50755 [Sorangium cellulosum]